MLVLSSAEMYYFGKFVINEIIKNPNIKYIEKYNLKLEINKNADISKERPCIFKTFDNLIINYNESIDKKIYARAIALSYQTLNICTNYLKIKTETTIQNLIPYQEIFSVVQKDSFPDPDGYSGFNDTDLYKNYEKYFKEESDETLKLFNDILMIHAIKENSL